MSYHKDLFIEKYDELVSEAEEAGIPIDEDKLADKAMEKANDAWRDRADALKDRMKSEGTW